MLSSVWGRPIRVSFEDKQLSSICQAGLSECPRGRRQTSAIIHNIMDATFILSPLPMPSRTIDIVSAAVIGLNQARGRHIPGCGSSLERMDIALMDVLYMGLRGNALDVCYRYGKPTAGDLK